MAAAVVGVSFSTPKVFAQITSSSKAQNSGKFSFINTPWRGCSTSFGHGRMVSLHPVAVVPDKLSDKVEESIKNAQETCSDDPVGGECAAAWDEVEELSAAASHARDRSKENSDPLENYCKDNPETEECRTYDN
ncbi:calvin cycle protein CP12-2, chloroplastic-like [Primulina huaijiensis]|uniref:calvin cycle protein CP12-2, chloroplastic-like n=1 Tax=Primulina huaijiensis TaxID=1492673 RepID=UPI003CC71EB7